MLRDADEWKNDYTFFTAVQKSDIDYALIRKASNEYEYKCDC